MPPTATQREELLTELEAIVRAERELAGRRLEAIARVLSAPSGHDASSSEIHYRSLRAEIAASLRISEYRADAEMGHAYALTESYPATVAALRAGEIDLQHAKVIERAGSVIRPAQAPLASPEDMSADEARELAVETASASSALAERRRAMYEEAVLPFALVETPNRLAPIARRIAEQWAVESIDERQHRECQRRRVFVVNREDGMADLVAYIPALTAHAIRERLSDLAREAAAGQDRAGSLDALRADALTAMLLEHRASDAPAGPGERAGERPGERAGERAGEHPGAHPGGRARVRARVQLVVPAEALARAGSGGVEPAAMHAPNEQSGPWPVTELAGYGPVSFSGAVPSIAEAAGWDRVVVGADTGDVLTVDRYRPSEAMRRTLAARDMHCRFPGCGAPAHRCDIDHTVDAALGGPTSTDNLAHLCRGHHTIKHHGGWRVKQLDGGVLEWTSPTGRKFRDRPPARLTATHGSIPRNSVPRSGTPRSSVPRSSVPRSGIPRSGVPRSSIPRSGVPEPSPTARAKRTVRFEA